MNAIIVKRTGTQGKMPFITVMTGKKKKSFKEACADCNAVPLDTFIEELKTSVKEYFDHA